MTREALALSVRSLVAEHFSRPLHEITESTNFHDDLEGDSLDSVEIVFALEIAHDVEIPDDDAERMKSVKDAIDYLARRLVVAEGVGG